jgi:hypothetical protein
MFVFGFKSTPHIIKILAKKVGYNTNTLVPLLLCLGAKSQI